MKNLLFITVTCLIMTTIESKGQSQTGKNDIIKVDVTKSYSSKKELILQDFMDVEYIALETNNEFVNQGLVMDIGERFILVKNRLNDGNIFVYDRSGKALRKINHRGQGPGEYTGIRTITLDEDNGEMFVNDTNLRKMFVYDLYGKFKRSFNQQEGFGSYKLNNIEIREYAFYSEVLNYDKNNLLCYDEIDNKRTCILISKQDGNITKEFLIPFKEKKSLTQQQLNGDAVYSQSAVPRPYRITPYNGNYILLELSSDTVYELLPDYNMRPFIVRTPPIESMNPEIMLVFRLVSEHYLFMETIKNVFDFDRKEGFPKSYLMYDKHNKTFSGYTVYNSDFSTKKEVYMVGFSPVKNHNIAAYYPLGANQLVESHKKGELKEGKLKELSSNLDEEDNPVIMILKHKK
jgi:hypothetical protein